MPDIGLIELILIGLIGFLVLGPERLPEFLGQVGRVVRQGRAWLHGLRVQLEQEQAQISQPVKDMKQEVEKAVGTAVDVATITDEKNEK